MGEVVLEAACLAVACQRVAASVVGIDWAGSNTVNSPPFAKTQSLV